MDSFNMSYYYHMSTVKIRIKKPFSHLNWRKIRKFKKVGRESGGNFAVFPRFSATDSWQSSIKTNGRFHALARVEI